MRSSAGLRSGVLRGMADIIFDTTCFGGGSLAGAADIAMDVALGVGAGTTVCLGVGVTVVFFFGGNGPGAGAGGAGAGAGFGFFFFGAGGAGAGFDFGFFLGAGGGVQCALHTSSQTNGSCPQSTILCLVPSLQTQYPELPVLILVVQKPFPV